MSREDQVGIMCYVHADLPGFTGILKQRYERCTASLAGFTDHRRYNDFLVNEVTEEGEVLHLTSTELPAEEAPTPPPAPHSIDTLLQRTAALLGQPQADKLKAWLQAVHLLLKGTFEHKLRFETSTVYINDDDVHPPEDTRHNDRDVSCNAASHNGPPEKGAQETANGQKPDNGDGGVHQLPAEPSVAGTFIQVQLLKAGVKRQRDDGANAWKGGETHRHLSFVLLKVNKETSLTINSLARFLGVKPSAVCTAGNKDKRAVTVQRVTCHKITATRVAAAVAKLHGVHCGNYGYAQRAVGLGALQGNLFQIVIRDVQGATDEQVRSALQGLSLFINYFGLQRFGSDDLPTHRVGAAILRGDWQGACGMLLGPRARDREEAKSAREAYANGDLTRALRLMPRECVAERAVLEGLKRNGANAWKPALLAIPRNLRTLYSHAYQSFLWNAAASHRVQAYGVAGAVAGDLVLSPAGEAGGLDRSTARLDAVHVVTQEEADTGVYSIRDVVLPLPGSRVQYPSHDSAAVYRTLAEKDGVDLQGKAGGDGQLTNAAGDYRHVVQAPVGLAFEVFRYDDADVELATNDWEVLEHGRSQEGVLEAAVREGGGRLGLRLRFQLPTSCYATMLLRELMKGSTAVEVHAIRSKTASSGKHKGDPEFSE